MELNIKSKVAGYYKLEAIKMDKTGKEVSRRIVADWFPNLITNQGLNRMGNNSDYLAYCQVGSGSSSPIFNNTSLESFIASTNTTTANTNSIFGSSPYYAQKHIIYRFAEGVAAGNLSEVGVGWNNINGFLFSRALILDDLGSSTTITILSDEVLDVSYLFRFYPKLIDDIGTVVFTGNIGGSYDWILRQGQVGTGSPTFEFSISMGHLLFPKVYNVDIGAITDFPSGGGSTIPASVQSYVEDSLERAFTVTLGLDDGNLAGGIRAFTALMGSNIFQLQFDPAILKTSSDLLSFVIKHSWGRF
jgi:hypothetical protein